MFVFTLLFGASKRFCEGWKAFIKLFLRHCKVWKKCVIFFLLGIGAVRLKQIWVLMTSEGSEVNEFAQTHLIMQAKFGKNPK